MLTSTEYYGKRTVSELRAILATDGIKVNARTKKADLVTYVVNMLDDHHSIADQYAPTLTVPQAMKNVYMGIGTSRRLDNYRKQNGTPKLSPKLTAKQARRATKKVRKELSYV